MIKSNVQMVSDALNAKLARIESKAQDALSMLGEQCVVKVRDRSASESWHDQTGNLRNSIGYVVLNNGQETSAGYQQGTTGGEHAQVYAEGLKRQYNKGLAMVVVAGMDYAAHVESIENKDVLASTQLWAEREGMPKLINNLRKWVSKL